MKVFGIGLNKTGTTTLGCCLQQLGFRHHSFAPQLLQPVVEGNLEPLFALVESYDSFDDWPFPLAFRALDRRFPGSKFILTLRSTPQRWLTSLEAHALRVEPTLGMATRRLAYGFAYPQLDPEAHLHFYADHRSRVRAHFRDRPADLLELCWEQQAGWQPLCRFLGVPVPEGPLPHANAAVAPDPARLAANRQQLAALVRGQEQEVGP